MVGAAFKGLTGPVGLAIGLFASMVAGSAPLRDALGGLVQTLGGTFQQILPVVTQALQLFAGVLGELGTAIAPVVTVVGTAFAAAIQAVLHRQPAGDDPICGALRERSRACRRFLRCWRHCWAGRSLRCCRWSRRRSSRSAVAGRAGVGAAADGAGCGRAAGADRRPDCASGSAGRTAVGHDAGACHHANGAGYRAVTPVILPPLIGLVMSLLPIILQVVETVLPPLMSVVQALIPVIMTVIDVVMQIVQTILPPLIDIIQNVIIPIIQFCPGCNRGHRRHPHSYR